MFDCNCVIFQGRAIQNGRDDCCFLQLAKRHFETIFFFILAAVNFSGKTAVWCHGFHITNKYKNRKKSSFMQGCILGTRVTTIYKAFTNRLPHCCGPGHVSETQLSATYQKQLLIAYVHFRKTSKSEWLSYVFILKSIFSLLGNWMV